MHEGRNETAKQCKADGKKDITIQSSKQQTDATTAVVTGKADVFFADSPVVGYAIAQTLDRSLADRHESSRS